MRVGIFTDNDFEKVNGVTTTLTAALEHAPAWLTARVYTAAALPVAGPDYLALRSVGVPIPFYPGMRMYVPRLQAFLSQARRDRLDLVHVTTPGPVGLAGRYVSWRLGLPLVGSFHTDLAAYAAILSGRAWLGDAMRDYLRWIYGACARVLVPSEHTGMLLAEAGQDPERIAIWPRGVDSDLFTPARRSVALRERWGVSDRRPAVLYVGRVSREKGLSLLALVSDRLHSAGVEHRLIVAGEGPMVTQLRSALPEALFTGMLSRQAVADTFASADLFVFPSCTDTAGNVVLEAQASGVPVVVAAEGGPREQMLDGVTGLVCRTPHVADWSQAVATLLQCDERPAFGVRARQYALTRRWSRALEPLYDAYREVPRGVPVRCPVIRPLAVGSPHDMEV